MSNTFGKLFKITTYGESHGPAIGVIIDGCPAGVTIDLDFIQATLHKRKPGQSSITSARKEEDIARIISGVFENKTTGTPIHLMIENNDFKKEDYQLLQNVYRPSHADFTYEKKYGLRDLSGGGRSSARETACRVAAGAIALIILKNWNIQIYSFVSAIGKLKLEKEFSELSLDEIYSNDVRCPDSIFAKKCMDLIHQIKEEGDSLGGIISTVVKNVPIGLGEPIYDKFHARLAQAMLSINAVHGFEYGSGFKGATFKGSEHNDSFFVENEKVKTKTNFSGGIQGGITNGMDINFNVAFKPTATIRKSQDTLDNLGNTVELSAAGRHDPCVVPRAVPIVEAMTALVLVDFILLHQSTQIKNIHVE